MVIRRRSSSNVLLYLICLHFVGTPGLAAPEVVRTSPLEVLLGTYRTPAWLSASEAQTAASSLEQALEGCTDPRLKAQLHYRKGLMYFKGRLMDQAVQVFRETARESDYPVLVRLCSLNMLGQIHRLMGADQESVTAFGALVEMGERQCSSNGHASIDPGVLRLVCLARIARAEIGDSRGSHEQSIIEYRRLVDFLRQSGDSNLQQQYGPLARDRLSQSHLALGRLREYFETAGKLLEDYPQYRRAPLIRLEMACVEFVVGISPDAKFSTGSTDTPAQAILLLRDAGASQSSLKLLETMDRLCREHGHGDAGMLLQYHYAWALDATGKGALAATVLEQITSATTKDADASSAQGSVDRIIHDYATIQRATLLSEGGAHRKALDVLSVVSQSPGIPHVTALQKDVGNAIQVLLREVPIHGTN
jgi:tetratricopeptide (TPR) repeat protein